MTWPNFYIVGAGRSGTTALYALCRSHPQIFMSHVKEPNYFIFRDERPPFGGPGAEHTRRVAIRDRRVYERLFAGSDGRPVVGEASVSYLCFPRVCHAIRNTTPDARLVIMLRQPVDRAYSSYMLKRHEGMEPCARFEDAWADHDRRAAENWWHCMHKGKSLYAPQVRAYVETFPREQIRIFLYDDFQRDPRRIVRELFSFLGVDANRTLDRRRHYEGGQIDNWFLRQIWLRSKGLRAAVAPVLPVAVRGRLFPFMARRRRRRAIDPPLAPDLRERFTREIRDDILRLQDLIKIDLGGWLQ
jgi:hypothetical protein